MRRDGNDIAKAATGGIEVGSNTQQYADLDGVESEVLADRRGGEPVVSEGDDAAFLGA